MHQVAQRDAAVDDVFDHQHVGAFDGGVEVPGKLHFAGAGLALAIAGDADKIDLHRPLDGARQVGKEDERAFQDAQQEQVALGVIGCDLRAKFLDPRLNPIGGYQHTQVGLGHGRALIGYACGPLGGPMWMCGAVDTPGMKPRKAM